jgi:hypothetical protein
MVASVILRSPVTGKRARQAGHAACKEKEREKKKRQKFNYSAFGLF